MLCCALSPLNQRERTRYLVESEENKCKWETAEAQIAQLESNVSKRNAHCQRLEDDKARTIEAMTVLRDKISVLEEECNALSSAEERAASYLMEIDRLREENDKREAHLRKKLAEATNTIESLQEARTRRGQEDPERVATENNTEDTDSVVVAGSLTSDQLIECAYKNAMERGKVVDLALL